MDSSSATYLMSSSSDEDLTDSLSDEDLTDSSSDDDLEMLAIGIAAYQMLSHRGLNLNKNPRQTVNMATLRNLKIKTGTCKRILKELSSYEKEVEREAAKTADMKEKGADPYDLKQQENVLAESRMMIPDCHKRLEASLADLKGTLEELEESGQKEGQEIDEARSIISEVETLSHTTEA